MYNLCINLLQLSEKIVLNALFYNHNHETIFGLVKALKKCFL